MAGKKKMDVESASTDVSTAEDPKKQRGAPAKPVVIGSIPEHAIELCFRCWPGSPLVVHNLRGKTHISDMQYRLRGMNPSKKGQVRDPWEEYLAALYILPGSTPDNMEFGIPSSGIKQSICSAVAFYPEIPITKAFAERVIHVNVGQDLTPIKWRRIPGKSPLIFEATKQPKGRDGSPPEPFYMHEIPDDMPELREDVVRLMGQTRAPDLRYRPQFVDWECMVQITFPPRFITPESILNLVATAGKYIGLCEWRPEKGGDWGMFCIDQEKSPSLKTQP